MKLFCECIKQIYECIVDYGRNLFTFLKYLDKTRLYLEQSRWSSESILWTFLFYFGLLIWWLCDVIVVLTKLLIEIAEVSLLIVVSHQSLTEYFVFADSSIV